jgi:hypothetical protein
VDRKYVTGAGRDDGYDDDDDDDDDNDDDDKLLSVFLNVLICRR